jgi:hypothetical protein
MQYPNDDGPIPQRSLMDDPLENCPWKCLPDAPHCVCREASKAVPKITASLRADRDANIAAWERVLGKRSEGEAQSYIRELEVEHAKAELRIKAIIEWLERNQPNVFSRGIWDAVPASQSDKPA